MMILVCLDHVSDTFLVLCLVNVAETDKRFAASGSIVTGCASEGNNVTCRCTITHNHIGLLRSSMADLPLTDVQYPGPLCGLIRKNTDWLCLKFLRTLDHGWDRSQVLVQRNVFSPSEA